MDCKWNSHPAVIEGKPSHSAAAPIICPSHLRPHQNSPVHIPQNPSPSNFPDRPGLGDVRRSAPFQLWLGERLAGIKSFAQSYWIVVWKAFSMETNRKWKNNFKKNSSFRISLGIVPSKYGMGNKKMPLSRATTGKVGERAGYGGTEQHRRDPNG